MKMMKCLIEETESNKSDIFDIISHKNVTTKHQDERKGKYLSQKALAGYIYSKNDMIKIFSSMKTSVGRRYTGQEYVYRLRNLD